MSAGIFAVKIGMTHIYSDENRHIPVTVLKVPAQAVTAHKSSQRDGYDAIQIGVVGRKHVAKPQQKELEKRAISLPLAHRHEIKITGDATISVGTILDVTVFQPGDRVKITGTTKGKGFAGTIKRHGFHRGPSTHGSKNVRQPGSIGSGYPQRVVPGIRMAGHMGHIQTTTKHHNIMAINEKEGTLAVSGTIPGSPKSRVFIEKMESA